MMKKQPHLIIPTLDFYPDVGGVQQYLYEVSRRLSNTYKITIVTPVAGEIPGSSNLHKKWLPKASFFAFYNALRSLQPDHLLIGHAHPRLMLAALLAVGKHYGVLAHGNDFLAAQRHWHHPLFNWLLSQAKPIVVHSQALGQRLQQLVPAAPEVIHPGTDPTRFTPRPNKKSTTTLTLLTISRLVPRKGIDTTLQVLPTLLKRFPNVQYHIGGTGPDKPRLEQLIKSLGLTKVVTFLGYISDEDLPHTYQEANIFVMPTREVAEVGSVEGFGIVYLEASASGLPVIAGKSGGAVEAVRDGETGLLVPPDDPQALTDALATLLADASLRQQLGQNGRYWVETKMNWDHTAQQVHTALAPHVLKGTNRA